MFLASLSRGLARHLHLACLALTAATAAAFAQTPSPSAADGFDPNVDGNVYAMMTQGDGKLLVVGQFQNVQPNGGISSPRHNIARLNADGSLDNGFDPDVDGAIRAVALDSKGRIVIGGDFTHVDGVARSYVARLNADGSLDTTFSPGVGPSIDPNYPKLTTQVFAVAVQPDDHVIVGGSFNSATPGNSTTAVTRNNLVRFDATGAIDPFNANPNAAVRAIAVDAQGRIIIGGGFNAVGPTGATTTRNNIARLNADGTVDANFDPNANNAVVTIAVQIDGKIVIGGYFSTLQPPSESAAVTTSHVARLNSDGSIDHNFAPSVGGNVIALALAADGGVLIGGDFTQIYTAGGVSYARSYAAKLTGTGDVDQNFNPTVNAEVDAFALQQDGKVVIGGYFTRAQPAGLSAAVVRNHLARILADGALDTAFQIDAGGRILAEVTQSDNKIVVAGSFTNIGGSNRYFVARLNPDGTLDTSYNPTLNAPAFALAYDSTHNQVIVGGAFTTVGPFANPTPRNHIARLNADGSVDASFDPDLDGAVGSIVIQKDGNILVGGAFTTANPGNSATVATTTTTTTTTAVTRAYLLRLTTAGQVDTTFNPNPNAGVSAIALQSDGKIIIGGAFTTLDPGASGNHITYRYHLARLNTDGSLDTGYAIHASDNVNAVVVQPDDSAVIGGNFTQLFPANATTATVRNHIARIKKDGTIDAAFDPNANGNVLALALQSDGKILVGGAFTIFQPAGDANWTQDRYVGRLTPDGKVDTTFNLDLPEIFGSRIDSISVQPSGDILIGGTFTSVATTLTPSGPRVLRNHFVRVHADGTVDTAFDPGAGGAPTAVVNAIAVQTNGKIVVGGSFNDLGGATSTNIAQFNQEGTPDHGFNAALATDGPVNAIGVRASGAVAQTQLGGFAWLNSNGSLRTSFTPGLQTSGQINAILPQSDGSVFLGGSFIDPTGTTSGNNFVLLDKNGAVQSGFSHQITGAVYGAIKQPDNKVILYGNFTSIDGTTRNYVARLNADGTLDTTFDPNPNSYVTTAVLQSDGSVVLGGAFTTLAPNQTTSAVGRNYIARVSGAGALDTGYNPNVNATVNVLLLQTDGKVVAGGSFTTVQPNSATTSTGRNYIARFNSDGTLDTTFDPNANNPVSALALRSSDSAIIMGGAFTTVGGAKHNYLAVVSSSGAPDASFTAGTNSMVSRITAGSDGSMLIAGPFTTVTPTGSTVAIARYHLARLTSTGTLDQTFNPDLAGDVTGTAIAADGSVLVGGTFTSVQPAGVLLIGGAFNSIGGLSQQNVAELNGDGSVNANFAPNPDKAVNAVLPLPDGRFLIGGSFTTIAGASRNGIARFNADGTLDTAFNPAISGGVASLALQDDGRVLVGTSGASGLIRLNTDGSVDSGFQAGASFTPAVAIAVQPDGKIIVGGSATGIPSRILRLNSDGSVDPTFTTVSFTGGDLKALTVQTDGSIFAAGSFASIGGQAISNLARLTSAGAVDASYAPAINGPVTALALQSDGRLMIGGQFNTVTGLQRYSLARLTNTGSALQALGVSSDGKTITWVRRGTAGELAGVTFEKSLDLQTWVPANQVTAGDNTTGQGTRVGATSDWQLSNATIPTDKPVYIRARGIVPTSAGTSVGVYETVQLVDLSSAAAAAAKSVAPVESASLWDATHYVWTLDANGVMRIADAYTQATLAPSQTDLIDGASHPTAASAARLADLSTRGHVSADSPLIGGFAVVGGSARPVLIRAVGPGLAPFSVTDFLKTPELVVYNSAGQVIATVKGWDSNLSAEFDRTGAFPLTPGSSDAAVLLTLQPGTYTVHVKDADGAGSPGGEALVEVYDGGDLSDTSAHLANLSARATVAPYGTLIGGLYVNGSAPKTMLIRGIGPALTGYGVGGAISDPKISVYDAAGNLVVSNDNWQVSNEPGVPSAGYGAAMSSAAASVGAFPFADGSRDAALVVTLPAGAYSVEVNGVNGASGAAMLEVYELP